MQGDSSGLAEVRAGDLRLVNENESVSRSVMHDCDPVDCSPPGSSIHGILQARILVWVAISLSRESLDPGIEHRSPALLSGSLLSEPPGKLRNENK